MTSFGNFGGPFHGTATWVRRVKSVSTYKVLAPISRGNLTIFPVVADRTHDTRRFPDPG